LINLIVPIAAADLDAIETYVEIIRNRLLDRERPAGRVLNTIADSMKKAYTMLIKVKAYE